MLGADQNNPIVLDFCFREKVAFPFPKAPCGTKEIKIKLKEVNPKIYQLVVQKPDAENGVSSVYKSFRSLFDTVLSNVISEISNKIQVIVLYALGGTFDRAQVVTVWYRSLEGFKSRSFPALASDDAPMRCGPACVEIGPDGTQV